MLKTGYRLSEEEISARYKAFHQSSGSTSIKELIWMVADILGPLYNRKILDVGCGSGDLLDFLAQSHPDNEFFGIDLDVSCASRLFQKLENQKLAMTLIQANAQKRIPFPDNTFDRVIAMETLEHTKDPCKLLGEIIRVCKPDGKIICTIPNATGHFPFHYFGKWGWLLPTSWLRQKLLPYEHPLVTQQPVDTCYTYSEILRLLKSCPLYIEKITGWRYFRPLLGFPLIRIPYQAIYPSIQNIMEKLKMQRFAYNLLFVCRPNKAYSDS